MNLIFEILILTDNYILNSHLVRRWMGKPDIMNIIIIVTNIRFGFL